MGALDAARTAGRSVLRGSAIASFTAYHYADAIAPRADVGAALRGYPRYLRDRKRYEELSGEELDRYEDDPQLRDWTPSSPFDPHYTYQDAWAANEIHAHAPARHVDVGSRISYVMGLTAFVP